MSPSTRWTSEPEPDPSSSLCAEYAEALAESEALIADLESLSKEVPDVKRHAGNFEPAETVKSVPLDPSGDASKQIRIGSGLDPK